MSDPDPGDPKDSSTNTNERSWTDLGPRIVSALVLLAITLFAVWVSGPLFAVLVGLVYGGIYREWELMITAHSMDRSSYVLCGFVLVLPLVVILGGLWIALVLCAIALLIVVVSNRKLMWWRLLGVGLFSAVSIALVTIRGDGSPGFAACIFLGATVWMTDTGAFFAGRQFGGPKIAPEISPAKTWSGAIGGLTIGALSGLFVWIVNVPDAPWWIGLIIAAAISVAGQLGDLAESWLKRHFRIKDSGDIIPGHGGLMDRLDSLTFASLFVFSVGLASKGTDFVPLGLVHW